MDTILLARLDKAGRDGDVKSLRRLLEEDECLLEKMSATTSITDNPLHIAALMGHAAFTAEIISMKPELTKQTNGQGLTALHLAAARGHLLVVKELLKVGSELCLMREEKRGLVPLHLAVINGRTLVVKELLETCRASLIEVTHGGETVLHLAVKSDSLEVLGFLISLALDVDNLNEKDEMGNTILHLAVARRQKSAIELLLNNPRLDVNSINSEGFTPLDLLLVTQQKQGDLVLGEMIREHGGIVTQPSSSQHHVLLDSTSSSKDRDIEEGNLKPPPDATDKRHFNADGLMVVATLVATITFQAALNPPGGFIPDDDTHSDTKGEVVLADPLKLFLIFDMIGLFLSVSVILLFLCVVPRKKKVATNFLEWILWLATFSTVIAFTYAVAIVYKAYKPVVWLTFGWLWVLMLGILWLAIKMIIFLLKKGKILKPIRTLSSSLIERPLKTRWQRLCDAIETTYELKSTLSCLMRIVSAVLIVCVVLGVSGIIMWALTYSYNMYL
ncbi:hypothetical protein LUZ60_014934 [Juncus effusus]|nr:hypothetical protein LUZ60_014934 [Juncus effusus]